MTDLYDNPMGLNGFEFVEFASPEAGVLEPLFEMMGFTEVAKHRSKEVTLWRQGDINFIINNEQGNYVSYFAEEHGPSACGMAFRVADSHKAYQWRWKTVPSRSIFQPARWSCACRPSRESAARRCT